MDGYALAKQVRQEPELKQSRLVALSAYAGDEHQRQVREAGFRHGLLGPIAEVVKLAGKPGMTPGSAAGRALRMHEMAQDGRQVPKYAIDALEDATHSFFSLMSNCPLHLRRAVSDRILDHVYLHQRRNQQRFWDDFVSWLKAKYGDDLQQLSQAWAPGTGSAGAPPSSWDTVRYVRVSSSPGKKADLEAFRRSAADRGEVLSEPEDEMN